MAGRAGTVRFGTNPDENSSTSTDGISQLSVPKGDTVTQVHYAYNPGRVSRDMGATRGGDPKESYVKEKHQFEYMSNHDSYSGGNTVVMNMDERKVLDNSIYSIKCEYDYDSPNGTAPAQTSGAFD